MSDRQRLSVRTMFATLTVALSAHSTAKECEGAFFVAAEIVRIEPIGTPLVKRTSSGKDVPLAVNDLVCFDEAIDLAVNSAVHRVELYANGRRFVVTAPDRFERRGGVAALSAELLRYVASALQGLEKLTQPVAHAGPTAVRGDGSTSALANLPIRRMRFLDGPNAGLQNVVPGVRPLLLWREGKAPFTCEVRSPSGDLLHRTSVTQGAWCELPAADGRSSQWLVADASGDFAAWSMRYVDWFEVPRPPWISLTPSTLTAEQRTAWAIWLWKEGAPAWRLQALAMLNDAASDVWVAGLYREHILAESVAMAPK